MLARKPSKSTFVYICAAMTWPSIVKAKIRPSKWENSAALGNEET